MRWFIDNGFWIEGHKLIKTRNSKDLFGMFDIIGISKLGRIQLAQVKKNINHYYSFKRKLDRWVNDHISLGAECFLCCIDNGIMRIYKNEREIKFNYLNPRDFL